MTYEEIIEEAEQLGLHWDHDEDLESHETLLVWHGAEATPEGGLLIHLHEGRVLVTDLNTQESTTCVKWQARLRAYVAHYSQVLQPSHEPVVLRSSEKESEVPSSEREEEWRPRAQRREGQFKAYDPLGHFYYVEIFREVSPQKETSPFQQLVTADGECVERIAKGRYRLAKACIDLSSNDPAAP